MKLVLLILLCSIAISAQNAVATKQPLNTQTGTSYTVQNGDAGKLVSFSNGSPIAVTLPQANSSSFKSGWFVDVKNLGVGTVTVTPTTSTIDGSATFVLTTGQGTRIISDGTNYLIPAITISTAQKSILVNTSGTNTGDQSLSGLVPTSRTVNGQALSANVTVTKSDVGLANVDNTSDATKNAAAVSLTNKKLGSLTSNGFVKTSAGDGTLSVDTSTYLTANQSITLSGDVSGTGTTAITTAIGASKVTNTMLAGSIDSTKLLDNPTLLKKTSATAVTQTNPAATANLMAFSLPTATMNTVDKMFHVYGGGNYTTAAAQTPTLTITVSLCTVSGCGSGTVVSLAQFVSSATTASVTNAWHVEVWFGTVATGASGTVESKGLFTIQLGATGGTKVLTPTTVVTGQVITDANTAPGSAIDLTGALFLTFRCVLSSSNAANNVKQRLGFIEAIN